MRRVEGGVALGSSCLVSLRAISQRTDGIRSNYELSTGRKDRKKEVGEERNPKDGGWREPKDQMKCQGSRGG